MYRLIDNIAAANLTRVADEKRHDGITKKFSSTNTCVISVVNVYLYNGRSPGALSGGGGGFNKNRLFSGEEIMKRITK